MRLIKKIRVHLLITIATLSLLALTGCRGAVTGTIKQKALPVAEEAAKKAWVKIENEVKGTAKTGAEIGSDYLKDEALKKLKEEKKKSNAQKPSSSDWLSNFCKQPQNLKFCKDTFLKPSRPTTSEKSASFSNRQSDFLLKR